MTVVAAKERLRAQIRARRREMDADWREGASRTIFSHLQALPVFQRARCIQTYVALRYEVDTHELIRRILREGKQVAVPRVGAGNTLQHYFIDDFSALQTGAFGILEPPLDSNRLAAVESFDLVLVPGLAFDRAGHRLGAGKGYYDRFLSGIQVPRIALAFGFQIVADIPIEPHDQRVDMIVTEEAVMACR